MASAVAPLTLDNRRIVIANTNTGVISRISNANTTNAITINSNLLVTTTTTGTHTLGLDAVAGPTNTFNGTISDGGAGVFVALSKTGAGTWAVTNSANNYTGTTSVNAGNLNYSANSSLTGQFTISGSGTLTLSGNNSGMTSPIVLSTATGTASSAPRLNINSATALGTGLLSLGGGAATDVVQLDNTSAGAVTVSTANAVSMNRNFTFVGTQNLNLGTGAITLGGMSASTQRIITTTANTLTLAGAIADGANGLSGISKAGAGTLALTGSNTYTYTTSITAGTLSINSIGNVGGGASAVGAPTTVANGTIAIGSGATAGTLLYTGSAANTDRVINLAGTTGGATLDQSGTGLLKFTSAFTVTGAGAKTLTLQGSTSGTGEIAGAIINGSNPTGLTKTGTGRWILSATNNTYTGTTTISGGVLQAVQSTGGIAANTGISLDGGVFQSSGTFTRLVGSVSAAGSTTYNMTANGGGFSAIDGKFTVTLDNTATVRNWGSTVSTSPLVGTLKFGSTTSNAEVEMTNNINLNGADRTIDVTAGVGGDFATMSGILSNSTGTAGFTKTGTGMLVLTNANTYNGTTTISGGTLQLGAGGTTGSLAATTGITNNANLSINRSNAFSQATDLNSQAISGTGGFTQAGSGSTTLNATNTYSGATNVTGGTLAITGSGSINSTSAINVSAGTTFAYNSSTALTVGPTLNGNGVSNRAVLSGDGTGGINASVTLNDVGDVLSPGNSPGVMGFGTNQSWDSFSYDWELNDWAASVAGTNIDQIGITGSLTFTGSTTGSYLLNILSLTGGNVSGDVPNFLETSKSWTILTTTGGISGFDDAYWNLVTSGFSSSPTATGTWSLGLGNSGNDLVLTYAPIPEPRAALLAALGALSLLRRRRRD
jgi:autotransporter-associated beta strand protein